MPTGVSASVMGQTSVFGPGSGSPSISTRGRGMLRAITAGALWSEPDLPEISVEEGFARRLGVDHRRRDNRRFIEKPEPSAAPSNLAFAGRYVFMPDIFDCHQFGIRVRVHGELEIFGCMVFVQARPDKKDFVCVFTQVGCPVPAVFALNVPEGNGHN